VELPPEAEPPIEMRPSRKDDAPLTVAAVFRVYLFPLTSEGELIYIPEPLEEAVLKVKRTVSPSHNVYTVFLVHDVLMTGWLTDEPPSRPPMAMMFPP